MSGIHLDWTASRAAGRNASVVTAGGLLDSSSLLRSTGAYPVADVAVQPFGDAEPVSTQQQAGSGAATSSIKAQATKTQQSGSSSDSGGSGSVEQGPDRMIIVAHLAEDLSWRVMTCLCYIPPPHERLRLVYRCPLLTVVQIAARRLPMHLGDVPTAVYQFVPNLEQHQQQCPPGQPPGTTST